jgi:selenobiotic family peptide radical SAM maturase
MAMPDSFVLSQHLFPVSCRLVGPVDPRIPPEQFPAYLAAHPTACRHSPFLPDLAAIEYELYQQNLKSLPFPEMVDAWCVNPTLQVVEVGWTDLPAFLRDQGHRPLPRQSLVLIYRPTPEAAAICLTPDGNDLLALKTVVEQRDRREVATEAGVGVAVIHALCDRAAQKGILLKPKSTLIREVSFEGDRWVDPELSRVETFALQWHLTQACDLRCRHCYDRSSRQEMRRDQAHSVLDQLDAFCQSHHVHGQVSFSGGNPMLSPYFYELYQGAVDRGFLVAVLGNPMDDQAIERMLAIRFPEFYQVSLEGLQPHNDYIRGPGHFERTLAFLECLRLRGVYTMVMLTLTRANCDQVMPLAELLRGRVDLFTFNRLAMVGEGAALASVEPARFRVLLEEFLEAVGRMEHLSLKDNLFNLLLSQRQQPLTGGCTGFGCGAAFNFVSVLPDGEVHACRKFPSPIGNLFERSLGEIYDGDQARRYRAGSAACLSCDLRPVCRGCPAVAHGFGLDIAHDLDPYCWK